MLVLLRSLSFRPPSMVCISSSVIHYILQIACWTSEGSFSCTASTPVIFILVGTPQASVSMLCAFIYLISFDNSLIIYRFRSKELIRRYVPLSLNPPHLDQKSHTFSRATLKSSDYYWPKPEPVTIRDGPQSSTHTELEQYPYCTNLVSPLLA